MSRIFPPYWKVTLQRSAPTRRFSLKPFWPWTVRG